MKFLTQLSFALILCSFFIMTSCGDGDDKDPVACTGITTLDGTVKINGDTHTLTIAQLLVNAGGAVFGDTYAFQIAGVNSDCTEVLSVFLTFTVPSGATLGGTYDIKDFFSASDDDATGSFITQILDPISQSSEDLTGGDVKVTKGQGNEYTLDMNATTVTGNVIGLEFTHTF